MIRTAVNGMCMAIADSVPGVSGSTIALILGFYDRLIDAVHALFGDNKGEKSEAVKYLLKLGTGWCLGMGICAVLLSDFFAKNVYFMSSVFLGLTSASIPYIISSEKSVLRGKLGNLSLTIVGAALVVGLSLLRSNVMFPGMADFSRLQPVSLIYIFFSGMLAICAMMLPGISGSTVLLITGTYLPAINAVRQLVSFNFDGMPGIIVLAAGAIFGISVSIKTIRYALKKHRSKMIYLILGLMSGSLFAIVTGPAAMDAQMEAMSSTTFDFLGFAVGIAVLLGLGMLKKTRLAKLSERLKQDMQVNTNEH